MDGSQTTAGTSDIYHKTLELPYFPTAEGKGFLQLLQMSLGQPQQEQTARKGGLQKKKRSLPILNLHCPSFIFELLQMSASFTSLETPYKCAINQRWQRIEYQMKTPFYQVSIFPEVWMADRHRFHAAAFFLNCFHCDLDNLTSPYLMISEGAPWQEYEFNTLMSISI